MNALVNARSRRSTATVMLLGWLFALVSGVANACLLEAREAHDRGSPTLHFAAASTASETAVGGVAEHDTDSGASRVSCLKACDDGSQTLLKQSSGLDLNDPGMAPFFAMAWPAATAVASAAIRLNDTRPAAPEPPVRLRFSRLAL